MTAAWLVVNADDLGVSRGSTLGIMRAHEEGIVTSASLAPTTAHYAHAVASCVRACPALGIGLHFTLTSGSPVSDPRRVRSLIGRDGNFRWRFVSLSIAARMRQQSALLDEIEVELEAQLDRLRNDGIHPDHINGERHVHLIPGIFERVLAAAGRHGVRYVRAGRDLGGRLVRASDAVSLVAGGAVKSLVVSALSARARRRLGSGIASPDHVASYLHTGRMDAALPRLLAAPADRGVTEVMVHPGIPEENGTLALGNRELERYLASSDRRAELDACVSARGATGDWTLTNYRSLAAQLPAC